MYVTLPLFLSFCLWMCIAVSNYIIIHSWCICRSLDSCFSLAFSLIFYICVQLYCHWLYVYRYVSYSAFLSISHSLCLSQCPGYIISNLHGCEQARSAQSVCNIALKTVCIIFNILNFGYIPTSLHSYFCLYLWLWMSVPVSGYVMIHCMCIYVAWSWLFFSFSLDICSSIRLYCRSL